MENVWIMNFPLSKQKIITLNQQQSMKNLTIGINALTGVSVLELNGLEALERLVIMRGGLNGGSGKLRVTYCSHLNSIDIGELSFMKYKYLELVDLPLLQRVKMENYAFQNIQTILMESKWENEMMNQTCLHYYPFNLIGRLLLVINVMIERR